jgi:FdhD protein
VSRVTVRTPIRRFQNGTFTSRPDTVAGEEPLEIRIGGVPISTTMRTPGHDIELVHGLLHAEGIISGPQDVIAARYCSGVDSAGQNTYNVLDVALTDPAAAGDLVKPRAFVTSSACGVCGTSSIEALQRVTRYQLPNEPRFDPAMISALPDELRTQQQAFKTTGGLHAAGLFDESGAPYVVREDIGRHNAVDKVVGARLLDGRSPAVPLLCVSGRIGFEIVQKATVADIGVLAAVGAPSSLAVQLAQRSGLCTAGFVRGGRFVVYSGVGRVGV